MNLDIWIDYKPHQNFFQFLYLTLLFLMDANWGTVAINEHLWDIGFERPRWLIYLNYLWCSVIADIFDAHRHIY